jgi:hypothetical protein
MQFPACRHENPGQAKFCLECGARLAIAGVLYAVVPRGNIKQEIDTSREATDAVKRGDPIPTGTVITLVDSRDGKLFRYIVTEKRTGWGAQ